MYRNDVIYIRIAHVSIYWPAASTASRRRSLVGCSVRGHNKGDHSTVPRGFNIYIKQFRTLVWTLRSDAGIDASAKSLSLYLHTYFGWRSRSGVSDASTLQRTRMYFKKDQMSSQFHFTCYPTYRSKMTYSSGFLSLFETAYPNVPGWCIASFGLGRG